MNSCAYCGGPTKTKFCNSSCSAKHNNKIRLVSSETKLKTSISLRKDSFKWQISGPYTRIYLCTCKISGKKWYSKTVKQIHPELATTYKEYSYACRFNFSINHYPKWFSDASELIKTYGWYSTPGPTRKGKTNLNGISRDHRLSVNYGFKNNIPPSIISHPANCKLLPHTENQSKKTNSSITLEELLTDISKFNSWHPLFDSNEP